MPFTFDFDASSSTGAAALSYHWDFGDGQSGTGVAISHTYAREGQYTVSLTCKDKDGRTSTTAKVVTASAASSPPPPSEGGYLLVKNNTGNTGEVGLWFNLPTPEDDLYAELTVSFEDLYLMPAMNGGPGLLDFFTVPTASDLNNIFGSDVVARFGVEYEGAGGDGAPRGFYTEAVTSDSSQWGYTDNNLVEGTEYTLRIHMQYLGASGGHANSWSVTVHVDGVLKATWTGWVDGATTPEAIRSVILNPLGAWEVTEIHVHRFKLGTSAGASDIFDADYASGAVTTVPGPWSGAVSPDDSVIQYVAA
jgi:PKD repeat protein